MPELCRRCQKNEARHDGRRLRWCKPCDAEYRREWVSARKSKGLPVHDEARFKSKQIEWVEKNRDRISALARVRWHDPVNSQKNRARNAVNGAVRRGKLKPQPCQCGAVETEAHHADYSRPLDVTWVCRTCHDALHQK